MRLARAALDMTQENVADELGVKRSTYAKIERGETKLSMKRLEEIAAVLKKDVNELMGFPKEGGANTSEPAGYPNQLTQQVLLLSSQLNAVQYKLGQLENDVRRLESKID